jgi:hypothetical protein
MEFRLEDESGLYLFAFLFLGGTRYTRLLKEEYCEYCISLARTISSKALRDKDGQNYLSCPYACISHNSI